ncbi:MAG: FAD-dependent oxidoreductase, partial [Sciscionella sp.]
TDRCPSTSGLGLDTAGVRTDKRGYVTVDTRLRTSNPPIYAAGDVTGEPAFTHVAEVHGSIAATNALLAPVRRIDHDTMPWVTFTEPEIAHVGLTESQARERYGDAVQVRMLPYTELDRAITEDDTDGFSHVVLGKRGKVLGATIVAPRAGEMLTELAGAGPAVAGCARSPPWYTPTPPGVTVCGTPPSPSSARPPRRRP